EPGRRYQQESSIHDCTSKGDKLRPKAVAAGSDGFPPRKAPCSRLFESHRPGPVPEDPGSAEIHWTLCPSFGNRGFLSLATLPRRLRLPICPCLRSSLPARLRNQKNPPAARAESYAGSKSGCGQGPCDTEREVGWARMADPDPRASVTAVT